MLLLLALGNKSWRKALIWDKRTTVVLEQEIWQENTGKSEKVTGKKMPKTSQVSVQTQVWVTPCARSWPELSCPCPGLLRAARL